MIQDIAKLDKKKRQTALDLVVILTANNIKLETIELLSTLSINELKQLIAFLNSFNSEDFEKFINCLSLLSKIVDTLNSHSRDLEIIKERIQEDNKKTQFEDSTDMMIKTLSKGVEKLNVR